MIQLMTMVTVKEGLYSGRYNSIDYLLAVTLDPIETHSQFSSWL